MPSRQLQQVRSHVVTPRTGPLSFPSSGDAHQQQQHRSPHPDDHNNNHNHNNHSLSATVPPPPPTPLDSKQLAALTVVLMNESICSTMLMPIVGLYVAHLQHASPDAAGYWSGVLIGVFQLGQVISGKWWGRFSDIEGRKPALMIGLVCSTVVMVGFGFASSLWQCIFLRFLHGVFNGNVLVAKAVIADITDKTNEARGFSLVSLSWALGSLLGPAVGGFLYDPVHNDKFRVLVDAVGLHWLIALPSLEQHPALLPSAMIAAYSLVAIVAAVFFIKESKQGLDEQEKLWSRLWRKLTGRSRPYRRLGSKMGLDDANDDEMGSGGTASGAAVVVAAPALIVLTPPDRAQSVDHDGSNEVQLPPALAQRRVHAHASREYEHDSNNASQSTLPSLSVSPNLYANNREVDSFLSPPMQPHPTPFDSKHVATATTAAAARSPAGGPEEAISSVTGSSQVGGKVPGAPLAPFGYREAFLVYPKCRSGLLLYMFLSASDIILWETLPLWAVATRKNGGLSFTSAEIGSYILMNAIPVIGVNAALPFIRQRFSDDARMWRVCATLFGIGIALVPVGALFSTDTGAFAYLVANSMFRSASASVCFSLSFLLIARSTPSPEYLGVMSGIGQSSACMTRFVVPLIASPLFAWSISPTRFVQWFPFNHCFVFLLGALPILFTLKIPIYGQ